MYNKMHYVSFSEVLNNIQLDKFYYTMRLRVKQCFYDRYINDSLNIKKKKKNEKYKTQKFITDCPILIKV